MKLQVMRGTLKAGFTVTPEVKREPLYRWRSRLAGLRDQTKAVQAAHCGIPLDVINAVFNAALEVGGTLVYDNVRVGMTLDGVTLKRLFGEHIFEGANLANIDIATWLGDWLQTVGFKVITNGVGVRVVWAS